MTAHYLFCKQLKIRNRICHIHYYYVKKHSYTIIMDKALQILIWTSNRYVNLGIALSELLQQQKPRLNMPFTMACLKRKYHQTLNYKSRQLKINEICKFKSSQITIIYNTWFTVCICITWFTAHDLQYMFTYVHLS